MRSPNCEERPLASSCLSDGPSVRMEQLCSNWTVCIKFNIQGFFENVSNKLKFHSSVTSIRGTSHKDLRTLMTATR